MAAMKVFSESLKFLKQSFLNTLHDRVPGIPPEYIHWVLTVPSIWTDKAKQFMRTAAIQADIPGHLLTLAYEPEAAALYCKNTPIAKKTNDDVKLSSFQDGDCFLVLDCGGGTADVTSYKVLPNGLFQELHYPTGGPWGGAQVDKNFLHFMEKIFGKEIWTSFQTESYEDALFLQRNFELKKRTVGEDLSHNEISLNLPLWLLVKSAEVTFPDGVRCTKNKLKISLELMTKLFDSTLSDIVKHLSDLLKMPIMNNIDTILMVGGFSECRLLRQTMQNQFSKMRIICPEDAVLSVLKGGVIFGNSPSLINELTVLKRIYLLTPHDIQTFSMKLLTEGTCVPAYLNH